MSFRFGLRVLYARARGRTETKVLAGEEDIDYESIQGLRLEAGQKLTKFKPRSVGQASRISGVTPADIAVLLIYLQKEGRNH